MAEEFDNIPRMARRRMITIAAWFNGGTASVLLVLLLRCQSLWREDSDAKWNDRLNDYKEQMDRAGDRKIQQADMKISPQIDETKRIIDSLSQRVDSLKAKKS